MRALKTILIIASLFLPGRLVCLAVESDNLLISEVLHRLKIKKELTGIQLTFDTQNGILEVKKGTGKGDIGNRDVIQILKTDSSVCTVKFLDITIIGDLDFTALPLQEYLGSQVFMIDKSLVFEKCRFTGKITSQNTDGLRVVFKKSVDFIECDFQGKISLEQTRFENVLTVKSSIFHENVVFYQTQFTCGGSKFLNVTFNKTLIFSLSIFEKKIDFIAIRCKRNAYFRYIKSKEAINFSCSHFSGEVDFGVSEFLGEACFEDVTFDAQLFFVKVNEKVSQSVHFDFDGANFKGKAYFRESLMGKAHFRPSQSQSLLFFDEANFRKVTFKEADFTGASFHTVDFSQAVFGDRALKLKGCTYKQMMISWEQLSGSLLNNLDDEDFVSLKANFEEMKKFVDACEIYYLMRVSQRKRLTSFIKIVPEFLCEVFLGYFVRPWRIIWWSLLLAFIFSFFYIGTELKDYRFKFPDEKEERNWFSWGIPIQPGSHEEKCPSSKKEKKGKEASFLRRWGVSFVFSLTLLFKISFIGKYIGRGAKKRAKWATCIEVLLGYCMCIIFLYSLARRSSMLRDILAVLSIF